MNSILKTTLMFLFIINVLTFGQNQPGGAPKMDEYKFDKDNVKIYFFGHASMMINFNGTIIHVDPVKQYAQYDSQPKADIILITHEHSDHLDKDTIAKLTKKETKLIVTKTVFDKLNSGLVLVNGKSWQDKNIKIEAVPAYNTTKDRDKYHPKGTGNGYILNLGNKRIYIAGDTEDIPEMANIKNIEIAFLPMNQPYTMTPAQVVNAVKMIKPKIMYPYHFGETDMAQLQNLMKDVKGVELKIRDMK